MNKKTFQLEIGKKNILTQSKIVCSFNRDFAMKSARINQYEGDILFNPSIRIFHYVCQFRSFTKAAKQLGITQSAVSQSIAQLEKQLGVELFDRTSRPMALTKEAQLLRNQILRDMSD
ncbi:MAG: LysR family transcriptional regulator, partial [Candidatus Aphodousia sp.]|nr:LysR family transcriptional regulator [Candidatus Aphodousia sp.]